MTERRAGLAGILAVLVFWTALFVFGAARSDWRRPRYCDRWQAEVTLVATRRIGTRLCWHRHLPCRNAQWLAAAAIATDDRPRCRVVRLRHSVDDRGVSARAGGYPRPLRPSAAGVRVSTGPWAKSRLSHLLRVVLGHVLLSAALNFRARLAGVSRRSVSDRARGLPVRAHARGHALRP